MASRVAERLPTACSPMGWLKAHLKKTRATPKFISAELFNDPFIQVY